MRRELTAVYDELKRRLQAGERSVYLKDDTLNFLRDTAKVKQAGSIPEKPPAIKPQPEPKVKSPQKPDLVIPSPPVVDFPDGKAIERLDFLRNRVLADDWCRSQVKPGKKVVFGVGNPKARILFCGEAPGADEEIQGEPFVGPAGQLLTKIIQAMGLQREDGYIANIRCYRPPMPGPVGNRPPSEAEMKYCLPFLLGQLDIIQPEAIVALGKTAMDGLMGRDPKRRMTKIRGDWSEFNGIPLMPTFHPSYLLRNQSLATKRLVWEDMLAVMDRLKMSVSDKQRRFFS